MWLGGEEMLAVVDEGGEEMLAVVGEGGEAMLAVVGEGGEEMVVVVKAVVEKVVVVGVLALWRRWLVVGVVEKVVRRCWRLWVKW